MKNELHLRLKLKLGKKPRKGRGNKILRRATLMHVWPLREKIKID